MFSLMSSELNEGATMAGPYIGQIDEVALQNADGSPVLNPEGQPVVIKLTVVASTAGPAPEPAPAGGAQQ